MVSNRNSGLFPPFSTPRTLRPLYWKLNVSHINLFLTLSEFLEREYSSALVALIVPRWADPDTVEIMLNADGTLWQERLGEPMRQIGAQIQATIFSSRFSGAIWLDPDDFT